MKVKYTITDWKYIDHRSEDPVLVTKFYISSVDDEGKEGHVQGNFNSFEDAIRYLDLYKEVLSQTQTKVVHEVWIDDPIKSDDK